MKDFHHVKVNSVNPSYIIINEVNASFSEKTGDKYLTFSAADKNKNTLEKYTKFWDEIKYHIQTVNTDKSGKYKKDYIKVKFNSDDDLPLNKILKLRILTTVVRSVFEEDEL